MADVDLRFDLATLAADFDNVRRSRLRFQVVLGSVMLGFGAVGILLILLGPRSSLLGSVILAIGGFFAGAVLISMAYTARSVPHRLVISKESLELEFPRKPPEVYHWIDPKLSVEVLDYRGFPPDSTGIRFLMTKPGFSPLPAAAVQALIEAARQQRLSVRGWSETVPRPSPARRIRIFREAGGGRGQG